MPLRQLKAKYRRKMGEQYWVVDCPCCIRRHWIKAGNYIADPTLALGVRQLPCGYTATIIPDKPLVVDRQKQNPKKTVDLIKKYIPCENCNKAGICEGPCDKYMNHYRDS